MSRTITALFDTRADAQAGCERLKAAHIDADSVNIHDNTSMLQSGERSSDYDNTSMLQSGERSSGQDLGMWASIKNAFLPDDDRHTYEEGVRRGGFLLTADVDEDHIDEAIQALEGANSVDIDERAQSWKSEGWEAPAMFGAEREREGQDEIIPVIEERLVVGKREVERGGTRVRSYITETPVHEQIRLRQEHVDVERVKVDKPLSDISDDVFRERSIEMRETGEEAVVGKDARIVEEVRLRKTADERTEDITETVRKTNVEMEDIQTDRN